MQCRKDIDLAMDLQVNPQFEDIDTRLTCRLGESVNFNFTWPAVHLSRGSLILDRRANSQLTARIDGPLEQNTPVTWSSSDPDICAVDQDGYLKAGREFGQAVITASFELDGETYFNTCEINVKVPVDKVSLNRRTMRLNAGGTGQLSANVSPRGASYKDVTWHTENDSIAAVDENGRVTAISPGSTVIYALTVDGYYRASCNITVGGER
jgi:uncharacterized protein YjdB